MNNRDRCSQIDGGNNFKSSGLFEEWAVEFVGYLDASEFIRLYPVEEAERIIVPSLLEAGE